jgi:hypothetical protein
MAPACAFTAAVPAAAPRATPAAAPRCAATRMTAGDGGPPKKQSLLEWVLSKTMPHQVEGDVFGYELFFKQSMEAREAAKEAEYKRED